MLKFFGFIILLILFGFVDAIRAIIIGLIVAIILVIWQESRKKFVTGGEVIAMIFLGIVALILFSSLFI